MTSVKSAEEYLIRTQRNALRHPKYGFDYDDENDQGDMQSILIRKLTSTIEGQEVVNQIPGRGHNRRANLRHVASSLYDDTGRLLGADYKEIHQKTAIALLPTGKVNACIFKNDGRGNELDMYAMAINHGLYFAASRLSDALTLEILTDDLAEYRRNGSASFSHAIKRFLEPTADVIRGTFLDVDWPAEAKAQFSIRSGALVSIVLQFVALHEFAHVVHGDVDSDNGTKTFSAVDDTAVEYYRSIDHAVENWPCEFKADEFAITQLSDWQSGSNSCWANTAQVYLFFRWLEEIESQLGRQLCSYHPPAKTRKVQIRRIAQQLGLVEPPEDYFEFIEKRVESWSLNNKGN